MMQTKRSLHLEKQPCVLEDDIKNAFDVKPSASIYYGRYPYKVVFDNDIVNQNIPDNMGMKEFDHDLYFEFRDFAGNFNDIYKIMFNNKRRIYLSDYQDFDTTISMYGDWIGEIQGPISQDHLELLYSTDLNLVVKSTPWYNKYEYKMELWASYYAIRNLWLTNPASITSTPTAKTQWKNQMQDELENFLETLMSQDFDTRINSSNYNVYFNATIFFVDSDYKDIITFKKLLVPDYRYKITKVIT